MRWFIVNISNLKVKGMFEKLKKIAREFGILAKPMQILPPRRSSQKLGEADRSRISAEQGVKASQNVPRKGMRGK